MADLAKNGQLTRQGAPELMQAAQQENPPTEYVNA